MFEGERKSVPQLTLTPRASGLRWGACALLALVGACDEPEPLRQPPRPPKPATASTQQATTAEAPAASAASDEAAKALIARAKPIFGSLPAVVDNPKNRVTDAKVDLGRYLYFDPRLSKNHDMSCNSCHDLAKFGIDVRTSGAKTSSGHRGAMGDRNTPTVYNAALHVAQFWDGRAADVEDQAKGPILNPVEMAMPDEDSVVAVLNSIEGYPPLFEKAFPDDEPAVTYDNLANAIGAFERKLTTRAAFDDFLAGDTTALDAQAQRGLTLFLDAGCTACHAGPAIGGQMFQKLGLLKPYPTEDEGRSKVTGNPAEKFFFKVPSLRNIAETAPYLHDGSIETLSEMVQLMAAHQTAKGAFTPDEEQDLLAFLKTLTGKPHSAAYIAPPKELPSGPDTPKADPS